MGSSLQLGIITAYIAEDWHSQQLMAAAKRFGDVIVINPEHLGVQLTADGVTLLADGLDLQHVDGFVLARGFGAHGNADFVVPVYQIIERSGKPLVNSITALLVAIDKFETSYRLQQAGIPTPGVVVAQDEAMAQHTLAQWGRAVAKPLYGSLGKGIELVEDTRHGREVLQGSLRRYGAVYLQEFIETGGRDIRAFVVGSQVTASIYRYAPDGDWRTNIHQGGRAEVCTLDPVMTDLAVRAAQVIGLDYTGVDLLEGPDGPLVNELNGNPLWQGVLAATGRNMADDIMEWVVARTAHSAAKGGELLGQGT